MLRCISGFVANNRIYIRLCVLQRAGNQGSVGTLGTCTCVGGNRRGLDLVVIALCTRLYSSTTPCCCGSSNPLIWVPQALLVTLDHCMGWRGWSGDNYSCTLHYECGRNYKDTLRRFFPTRKDWPYKMTHPLARWIQGTSFVLLDCSIPCTCGFSTQSRSPPLPYD